MNFFNAKKIIKGIAFVVMALLSVFGVNAEGNYKDNIEYKNLDPNLQSEIDTFHSHVLAILPTKVRNHANENFCSFLESVNCFLSKFDDNPTARSSVARVIGISSFDKGYIVCVRLLSEFVNLCKSLIKTRFSLLGYVTPKCNEYYADIIAISGTRSSMRHWSVKVLKDVSTASVFANSRTVLSAPTTADADVAKNKHNNETEGFYDPFLSCPFVCSSCDPFQALLKDPFTDSFDNSFYGSDDFWDLS